MVKGNDLLIDGPERSARTVVLAHGAGAPMDSPFMERMATGLAGRGLRTVRFEFPYMQRRRETGKRGAPDAGPKLARHWLSIIDRLGDPARLVIGGKSMGGRIASLIADEAGVGGLICLGYPFHPPGRPERLRVAHLLELRTPALVVQGTRDALGTRDEIGGYGLPPSIRLVYLEDGDHSFKPRVRSGQTEDGHLERALETTAGFVSEL